MLFLVLLLSLTGAFSQEVTVNPVPAQRPQAPKPDRVTYKPDELCTVEGVARNSATDEPLKKVTIYMSKMDPRNQDFSQLTTSTNSEGKFAMKAIEPGQYRLSAERAGFVRSAYGAKPGNMQGGTTLTLSKSQNMKDLEFRLLPQSVVTGRVLDEDGDPIPNAQVQLMLSRFFQGKRQMMPTGYASTNDLGEYRLFAVAAGKYFLSVNLRNFNASMAVDRSVNQQTDEGYAATYYPGTNDLSAAALINVATGRTMQGMDVTLRKTRTYRIKGTIAGLPRTGRMGAVYLRPKEGADFNPFNNSGRWRGPEGEFEIRGVLPGSYYVQAQHYEQPDLNMTGRVAVEVGKGDVEGVVVQLGLGIEVQGSIKVEGEGTVNFEELNVGLTPKNQGMMMGMSQARVKEGGTYSMNRVSRDAYYIRLTGLPNEFYLKSARLGDVDILENGLDLEQYSTASGMELVLSASAASVEGAVTDEKGNPVKGASVLLRPSNTKPPSLALLQKTASTDQDGKYKFQGVAPGTYHVIAFDGVDLMELQDPDLFQQNETSAVKLELKEKAQESRALKAVVAEKAQ